MRIAAFGSTRAREYPRAAGCAIFTLMLDADTARRDRGRQPGNSTLLEALRILATANLQIPQRPPSRNLEEARLRSDFRRRACLTTAMRIIRIPLIDCIKPSMERGA